MLKLSTTRLAPFALGSLLLMGCSPIDRGLFDAGIGLWEEATAAVSRMIVLFVIGVVLVALAPARMEKLEAEIAHRPMRCFALGLVTTLIGAVLVIALCVTVLGIPIALAGVVFAALAGYAGICAALATVGGALVGHRSKNVYVHLAVGCAIWLVIGGLPWLGEAVSFALAMVGFGTIFATRCAGLVDEKHFATST